METVEVVIRIPKQDFDFIKDEFADGDMPDEKDLKETTYYAIANGTVLPKGHGRLIDASQLLTVTECKEDGTEYCYIPYAHIEDAPTIIEADKEEENENPT